MILTLKMVESLSDETKKAYYNLPAGKRQIVIDLFNGTCIDVKAWQKKLRESKVKKEDGSIRSEVLPVLRVALAVQRECAQTDPS